MYRVNPHTHFQFPPMNNLRAMTNKECETMSEGLPFGTVWCAMIRKQVESLFGWYVVVSITEH